MQNTELTADDREGRRALQDGRELSAHARREQLIESGETGVGRSLAPSPRRSKTTG